MTAVFFGLLTAMAWGVATLSTARSSRLLGATSTVTWISFLGLLITAPFLVADGPVQVDSDSLLWLGISGVGYVLGLLLMYTAVRRGPVGIAAPIASLEGAVAALLAVLAGEQLAVGSLVVMAIIVIGLLAATLDLSGGLGQLRASVDPGFLALALAAAFMFGLGLYGGGRVSGTVPTSWVVASGRLTGALFVGIPVLFSRRLVITRQALPWVVVAATAEVVGYALFATGAQSSISITAVLASQFAAVAVIGAYLFFGERFSRPQRVGVVLIAIGVACLAALQG